VSAATVALTFRPSDEALRAIREELPEGTAIVPVGDVPEPERPAALRGADALIGWFPNADLVAQELDAVRGVPFVQLLSAGADTVPPGLFSERVTVAANVGAYAEPMAEHALAMALALIKRLPQKHRELSSGVFEQRPPNRRVAGSACVIVGFGGIGKATARLMRAMGVRVSAVNTSGRTDEAVERCGTLGDLRAFLSDADIVVLSIPLTERTAGLIGTEELGWMKPDTVLVNVARGAIVDERALYEHLVKHPDFSVAIDTWWVEPIVDGEFRIDFPFFDLPNVLGSPHNSALVHGIDVIAARSAAANVARYLADERVQGVVQRGAVAESG
jgi:phosphoglycerate dehydrogenase-like enzyme